MSFIAHAFEQARRKLKRKVSRALGLEQLRERLHAAEREREALEAAPQFVRPGHFYSPVPSLEDLRRLEPTLYVGEALAPRGIDLRGPEQLALHLGFKTYYDQVEFPAERSTGWRYSYKNNAYSYSDAFHLHSMIRHARPKRLIEVGSGFSSCVALDTNERCFGNAIRCTFIEPHPKLLRSLIWPEDERRTEILPVRVQQTPLDRFRELESGDILFIDSTHVVRVGSDVNYLLFTVLPALAEGVYIHLHDIFYPFEYPMHWLLEGRQWSELYLLRAFLMFNPAFQIVLMNSFLEHRHPELMREQFPLCAANPGGSIWLRKLRA